MTGQGEATTGTVLVTGGSSGIGAATIKRLQADGATVINLDIAPVNVPDIRQLTCDLSQPDAIEAALHALPAQLDGVVHVAGVAPGAVDDMAVMAINFLGMRMLNEALEARLVHGGRAVIVASSIGRDWQDNRRTVEALLDTTSFADGVAWLDANPDAWQGSAYKFSKQCAVAYTPRAAGRLKPKAVNVNCVNPGIVETQLSPWFRDLVGAERYDSINEAVGRPGRPEDIAGVIRFLLSVDATWVNGVEFQVDGGYRAGVTGGWIPVEPV